MDGENTRREAESYREVDLLTVVLLLRKDVTHIILFAIAGFVLMLIVVLTTKPIFSSTAILLVPQGNPTASSLALQLATGGLDLTGGGYEIYQDILRSRTVADGLIDQYDLKKVYGVKTMTGARAVLAQRTLIESAKEGLVRVTVEDVDAKRAADLANSYLAELDKTNQQLAVTSAGQQRAYFEREMVKEKNALADAEVELKRTQEETGVLVPQSQAMANLSSVETTRAQIRFREVQLGALLQGATEQNPEVIRLHAEITGLERQLQGMQTGGGGSISGLPTSKTPEIALKTLRNAREVKFHETLFEMLARQYEGAKQNEAKTISMIEVLDRAVPAEHKNWPPRALFCLIGLLGGGVIGICVSLFRLFLQNVRSNPENQKHYAAISSQGSTR
jgi:tyrosine-protein kinase Etk/Wzc